jgi:hypothetical protein
MKKASLLTLCLFALPALGERPPEHRKDADLVVTGKVLKVETSDAEFFKDGVMTTFTATVKVSKVEKVKGEKVKAGDTIKVTWFAVTKTPSKPPPAAYGQNHGIKAKDEATFWLLGGGKGPWQVIYNRNGIEKVKK